MKSNIKVQFISILYLFTYSRNIHKASYKISLCKYGNKQTQTKTKLGNLDNNIIPASTIATANMGREKMYIYIYIQ
jgi:hypothetical protein